MDTFKAAAISAAGMAAQKTRIETAAANLANMHTTSPEGAAGFQPLVAVVRPGRAELGHAPTSSTAALPAFAPVRTELVAQSGAATRTAYEPGHPHADSNGMVSYPAVDHAKEMMTVMTALRAYEANLAALQATKTLATKALEIGGQ